VQVVLFTAVLAAGYVYIWRKGVLNWGPSVRPVSRRVNASHGSRAAA
jgi:hypothetical protein